MEFTTRKFQLTISAKIWNASVGNLFSPPKAVVHPSKEYKKKGTAHHLHMYWCGRYRRYRNS
jgi:hypothetical protein